jgi:hypothetical protein
MDRRGRRRRGAGDQCAAAAGRLRAGDAPVAPTPLNSTVTVSIHGRGTRIQMNCTYGVSPQISGHDETEAGDNLAMVVVGRDGGQSQLATWVALTGVTATPSGSTSLPMDQIAAVQIVSADQGDVLLQRNL